MYLSHIDSVPITKPRTLKPPTIVEFGAFENFYGAFPTVFLLFEMTLGGLHIVSESLSEHIQVVQNCAETLKIT